MKGVLLANLGTPDSPDPKAVGAYLKEFLMDPAVIPMPYIFRWILVHLIIVPRRKKTSAELYRTIWTDEGSPLLLHTETLAVKVQTALGSGHRVTVGMRYGKPSLESAFDELGDCDEIRIVPLFPQFADATTGSLMRKAARIARKRKKKVSFLPPFHSLPAFVSYWVRKLKAVDSDKVLFTFHGLPEKQVLKADRSGTCLKARACCENLTAGNRFCYRAQCYATAHAISERAGLDRANVEVSFQSRLGRAKWIGPYTDETLTRLGGSGVKRLTVCAPSFVADCLETLEELGERGKETFRSSGGGSLRLLSCPNGDDEWADSVAAWIKREWDSPSFTRRVHPSRGTGDRSAGL